MKPARWILLFAVIVASGACGRSSPGNVAATVNGRSITYAELDKQVQFMQFGSPPESIDDDQAVLQRLEVLRAMIDNEIMLQRAEREGLLAVDTDVEAKLSELRSPYTEEEFQSQLNERKMTIDDLRAQLRRDLSVQKILNKETSSKITITDKEIRDFYETNQASFNRAEPQLHLSQILVTPVPDPNVRNLKGDNAMDDETAEKKANSLFARLKQGEDFAELAANYSEDPDSTTAGGDLGFIPESALEKANVDLRRTIMDLTPGEITPVLKTAEGYRILKLITREPAGQRDLSDPNVQQTIRQTLINRKDQLLRAAFYEVARNDAEVKNYFADSIVEHDQE